MQRLLPLFLSCLFLLAACGQSPRAQFGEQLDAAFDRFLEDTPGGEAPDHTESTAALRADLAALDASSLSAEEQRTFLRIQEDAEKLELALAAALEAGEDVDKPPFQWANPEQGKVLMGFMGDTMEGIMDLGVEIQGESFLDD